MRINTVAFNASRKSNSGMQGKSFSKLSSGYQIDRSGATALGLAVSFTQRCGPDLAPHAGDVLEIVPIAGPKDGAGAA